MDLSWRAWIAGEPVSLIATAHIHHQGASSGERAMENRTNETKRYFANRNQLLVILKNARSLLLLLALSQTALISIEAIIGTCLARRASFFYQALLRPLADCWRLRRHIREQRKKNHRRRQHGDWWITKHFFRLGFGRWTDVKRLFKFGIRIEKSLPIPASKSK